MSKEVKIALFNKNTPKSKVVKNVGDFVLDNICVSCTTKEDLTNGNYELDAKFIIDNDGVWRNIEEESILKVKMDYGYEIFKVVKALKDNKYVTVFARQITIQDQLSIQLADVRPTNSNGYSALDSMIKNSNEYLEGRQYARDLEFSSDISKVNTAYYMEKKLYQALFDCDQSFMNRWGGEIQRRGYLTTINTRIGQDRGFQVRYGKNLTGFESETNIDSVVTRIKPKAYNGHTIEGYVQSGNIDKYATVKTIEIKYDNVKLVEDCQDGEAGFKTLEELRAELIRLATLEFTEKHVDELQASYRVNFIDLFKTEEYKKYSILERVYLGDVVNVHMDKLEINISVRAIIKRYDVLKQRTIEIQLSNIDLGKFKPTTIATIKKELDKLPDNFENILNQAKDFATDLINAGINGYVVVNKNEILIMDTPDKNTATKLWRFNLGGIAHSSNGYYGQFNTAWTMDGKIVLNELTCEGINALLIRGGTLQSLDGSCVINLANGVISISKGRIVGKNMILNLDTGEIVSSYASVTEGRTYDIKIANGKIDSDNYLNVYSKNGGIFGFQKFDGTFTNQNQFAAYDWGCAITGTAEAQKKLNIIMKQTNVTGDFTVTGTKNCVQDTENYGKRLYYATEDCESLLTDTGKSITEATELGTYERVILIDNIFKESVDLSDYYIFLTKYGKGDIWIKEQTENYFIVESDNSIKFDWKVEASRKGYCGVRLEKHEEPYDIEY